MNSDTRHRMKAWVNQGGASGAKQGATLAFYYALLAPILFMAWTGQDTALQESMFIYLCLVFAFFGIVLSVPIAFAFGGFTGALLGMTLSLSHIAPHRWNRLAVAVGIGGIIVAGIHQLVWGMLPLQGEIYFFFLAVPSLVYLGACAWLSDELPRLTVFHTPALQAS